MKEYGLSYVYYEVSDLTIIVRDCISEVKQPAKAESRELYFSNHFRRMAEVAEIILNDKKVIFLLNTLLSGGAETSLVKINKILDFYTGSKNISKKLVKKYILALCDTYNFHQTNNVKYFEFLLINKLSTERIIF
ncbi:hypothetical protein AB9Q52_005795 [Pantoea vagans]|uniref:hypothetical protein n=1 Tax=Pantoea vagans TaxID=470934 RepID=UPI003519AC88